MINCIFKKTGRSESATYLEDFNQCLHAQASYAKWHAKDGRHNDEDQQQGEPHSEGNAQEHAQQIIEGRREPAHPGWQKIFHLTGKNTLFSKQPRPSEKNPFFTNPLQPLST